MACLSPHSLSYSVVIIPLRTRLYSLDALRFHLWIKRLKDLEREKDSLWLGLEVLEQARLWYRTQLEENQTRQARGGIGVETEMWSCRLRSRIQRVNGSLGSLMTEPNVTSTSTPSLPDAVADCNLRWNNTLLAQEVSEKNGQISMLELEKQILLQQISEL